MAEKHYSNYTTTQLPNGGEHVRYQNGSEGWYDRDGQRHRESGPAIISSNGYVEYWVNGKIPISIGGLLIISEEIDLEMFPSACMDTGVKYQYNIADVGFRAYRLNSHDLALAILYCG